MNLKKKIIIISIIILCFFSFNYFKNMNNNVINNNTNLTIQKNIFKNRLLDDIIEEFYLRFNFNNNLITNFTNKEIDNTIYFYSQLTSNNEAYFIIEYKDFEIKKLQFNFTNASKNDLDSIYKIISTLISISDINISSNEANKIILNMMKRFEKNNENVIFVYENNLIYSINIADNNTFIFTIE